MHDKNVIMAKMARSGDNLSLGDDIFPIQWGAGVRVRGRVALVKRAPPMIAPLLIFAVLIRGPAVNFIKFFGC